jgi:hypothetical protein
MFKYIATVATVNAAGLCRPKEDLAMEAGSKRVVPRVTSRPLPDEGVFYFTDPF